MKTVIPEGYKSLLTIYDTQKAISLLKRLFEANVAKDKEILEEILTHLHSMRDTWKEVMKRAKQPV